MTFRLNLFPLGDCIGQHFWYWRSAPTVSSQLSYSDYSFFIKPWAQPSRYSELWQYFAPIHINWIQIRWHGRATQSFCRRWRCPLFNALGATGEIGNSSFGAVWSDKWIGLSGHVAHLHIAHDQPCLIRTMRMTISRTVISDPIIISVISFSSFTRDGILAHTCVSLSLFGLIENVATWVHIYPIICPLSSLSQSEQVNVYASL